MLIAPRISLQKTNELLKAFLETSSTAHSTFHIEKAEANPTILHAEGSSSGYEQAKHAIERDLKYVMRSHSATSATREDSVTYSVHYSDVNGLSKLENYILGLEVGKYFGESLHIFLSLNHVVFLQRSPEICNRGFQLSYSTEILLLNNIRVPGPLVYFIHFDFATT